MKKLFLLSLSCILSIAVSAQFSANPVNWTFSAKKISNQLYEVRCVAVISGKYHMYALHSPSDPEDLVPTSFTFTKNPLLSLQGKVKEKGKKITRFEEVWKARVSYFENSVEFVQMVKTKVKVPTSLKGTVEYMVCDDRQCLPPKTIPFDVKLAN